MEKRRSSASQTNAIRDGRAREGMVSYECFRMPNKQIRLLEDSESVAMTGVDRIYRVPR